MTRKLTEEHFKPVYALDQRLDTILGYDYLRVEVHNLSAAYPDHEHYQTIRQIADISLAACREEEVAQARELKRSIERSRVSTELNNLSGVQVAERRLWAQREGLDALQHAKEDLFTDSSMLSEATAEEREIVRAIVQRKRESIREAVQTAENEFNDLKGGVEGIKAILQRPIIDKPEPLKEPVNGEIPEAAPDLLEQFMNIVSFMRSVRSNMAYERQLIHALYPELYLSDRPEAYRQFDVMYKEFDTENASHYYKITGALIQRGKLWKTNQAGRPIGTHANTIYRIVSGGDDKILKSNGGIQQRLTIDNKPHVVAWSKVTPHWTSS